MTDLPIFRRDALTKAFNGDQRLVSAFEQLVQYVLDAAAQAQSGATIADVLGSASILTLGVIEGLEGARIMSAGAGLSFDDNAGRLTVSLDDLTPKINGGFPATFIVTGATNLILPLIGTLATLGDVAGAVAGSVTSFNTRTGAVTLTSADVTGALGYTPTSVTGLAGVQSIAAFKTGLSLVKADVGLGSVDNTADAAKNVLTATKLLTARTLAMSGDVVWSVSFDGSGNVTAAGTIQAGAVTLAKMADIATGKVIGRTTAGTGAPEALSTTGTGNVVLSASPTFTGTLAAADVSASGTVTAATKVMVYAGGSTGRISLEPGDATRQGYVSIRNESGVEQGYIGWESAAGKLELNSSLGWEVTGATTFNTIITGAISGNAGTATALQTSRNFSIGGSGITAAAVGFTGSAAVVLAASVDAGHITLARMADVATATVFYRKTAGTGAPEVQTLATLKADLGLTGTNSGDQTITLTGDVTGSGTGSFAATIGANKVTFAKFVAATAASIVGATAAGNFAELTPASARTVLALVPGTDVFKQRTITAPAAGITVSNGDGVSGNPTLALANDLAALEALSGTNTIYYRSAADTWTAVTIGGNLGFSAGTLGSSLTTAATTALGTSGATIPLLSTANTWTTNQTFNGTVDAAGNTQVTGGGLRIQGAGGGFTGTGAGFELEYSGGEAYITGYDRGGTGYKNLNFRGLAVKLWANGTNFLTLESHFGNFANDAAAATGSVPVGGMYRNGSALMVRVV